MTEIQTQLKIDNLETQNEKLRQQIKSQNEMLRQQIKSQNESLNQQINDLRQDYHIQATIDDKADQNQLSSIQASFTAYPSGTFNYNSGDRIVFDSVISNFGKYYDASTSSFKCPVTGTYLFSVSLRAPAGNSASDLVKKNVLISIICVKVQCKLSICALLDCQLTIRATLFKLCSAYCQSILPCTIVYVLVRMYGQSALR